MLTGGLWECFNGKEPLGSLEKTSVVLSINLAGLAWGSQHSSGCESQQVYWLADDGEGIEFIFCQPGGLSCAFAGHH